MTLRESWAILGVEATSSFQDIKKAFKSKVRLSHPDITGDDGTLLQRVQLAFKIVEKFHDPGVWDAEGVAEGVPAWAVGLLQGVAWSTDCPSFAVFLGKPDKKALAVGELNEATGIRPWAAAWGKFSQEEANQEALRICSQNGGRCRLVFVGSGKQERVTPATTGKMKAEHDWWQKQVKGEGQMPKFGWLPTIDPAKEKVIGYKSILAGPTISVDKLVRVPVFKPVNGGTPYYYTPLRPKERVHLKSSNFKRPGDELKNIPKEGKSSRWDEVDYGPLFESPIEDTSSRGWA